MPNPPVLRQIDPNRAYYSSSDDYINMPSMKMFESSEHFYTTFFHELIHAAGHSSRLIRPEIVNDNGFGTKSYSKEELVAEIGACFLANHCQIGLDKIVLNSASYLADWLKVLKEDPKFIFKVSADAQKAVDYVLTR